MSKRGEFPLAVAVFGLGVRYALRPCVICKIIVAGDQRPPVKCIVKEKDLLFFAFL